MDAGFGIVHDRSRELRPVLTCFINVGNAERQVHLD